MSNCGLRRGCNAFPAYNEIKDRSDFAVESNIASDLRPARIRVMPLRIH